MSGRRSQRKGASGERELASILSDILGVECVKGSSPWLPGIVAPDIHLVGPLHIEVKRRETFSIPAAVRQAKHDTAGGRHTSATPEARNAAEATGEGLGAVLAGRAKGTSPTFSGRTSLNDTRPKYSLTRHTTTGQKP